MKLNVELKDWMKMPKICIDGKDISSNVTEIKFEKTASTIPVVTMKFIPDKVDLEADGIYILRDVDLSEHSIKQLHDAIVKKVVGDIHAKI